MNPPPRQSKPKNPWSPIQLQVVCILFGALPATLLWTINNRRLGIVQTTATWIFMALSVALHLLILLRLHASDPDSLQSLHFHFLGVVMTIILSWQIFVSQRIIFARYRRLGGKTATFFWWPLIVGLLWGALALGADSGAQNVHTERDYHELDRVAK